MNLRCIGISIPKKLLPISERQENKQKKKKTETETNDVQYRSSCVPFNNIYVV